MQRTCWVKQGEVALMRGERIKAIESLETAVELSPNEESRRLLATLPEKAEGRNRLSRCIYY